MKTTKNAEKNKPDFSMTTPSDILEEVGIAEAKCAELHRIKHGVAIIHGRMTAFEMIETIEELSKLAEFLTVQLSKVCGSCDDCGACGEPEQEIKVPPELLDEVGIPRDAKLEAYADPDERLILVGPVSYDHDLSDIPKDFLEMLEAAGVCLGELNEHLMLEDIVYGE